MIILDTNVVSELMRLEPDRRVMEWVDLQTDPLFLTSVSVGELSFGLARLPVGRRRAHLATALARVLNELFDERVLPFDAVAAVEYGDLLASRTIRGRPTKAADVQIAAIAWSHGATVATRDTADFEHPGLHLVDPWTA